MRCLVVLVLFGVGLSALPVRAQVINGEGTYDGSSLHEPPAPDPDESSKRQRDDAGRADTAASSGHAAHRD